MIFYIVSIILIFIGLFMLFLMWIKNKNWHNKFILKQKKCHNYAIIIPARYESNVIEGLLKSIKSQTSLKNTYVIVESLNDPTCNIVKKYNAQLFVRKDLKNKHRKGYALDEVIKYILERRRYDLYFIFDADNIVGDEYFNTMISYYEKGYDICTGYRNIKNNTNTITMCSGLVFSLINTLINKARNVIHRGIIISGTGYFIDGNIIDQLKGFPFNSLTEDYELSLYASANDLKTYYVDECEFYDEQPNDYNISITQRTRWVKGFFEARKKRLNDIKEDYSKLIGVTPYIFILLGISISIIVSLFNLIIKIIENGNYLMYLKIVIGCILFIYIVLMVLTIIMLAKEKNKLNMDKSLMLKAIFFNPIFLASFVRCLFKSFGNVKWDSIKHGK